MNLLRTSFLIFGILFSFFGHTETLRLSVWHQMIYSHRSVLDSILKDFERQNPEIVVTSLYRETEELRSSYQSAAMGGSGPDLIFGPSDQVGPFTEMGLLEPMDSYFQNEELDDFDPLAIVRRQNQIYMIGSTVGNHLTLIYNRDLIPHPPRTVNELIQIAKSQTRDLNNDGKIDRFGLVFNFTEPFFLIPWIHGYGGEVLSAEGLPQLDQDAVKKSFLLMQDFRDVHKIIPKECDYEQANALFKEGRAAIIINGDWSWGDYKKAKMNFAIAPLPFNEETNQWVAPYVSTTGWSLNPAQKDPLRKEAAVRLLKFLISSEVQKRFSQEVSTLPSRLSVRKTPEVLQNPLLSNSTEILSHGKPMPILAEMRAVWDALRTQYQAVLAGSANPNSAAAIAQTNAQTQIKLMNQVEAPGLQARVLQFFLWLLCFWIVFKLWTQRRYLKKVLDPQFRFPILMTAPALICLLAVVFFPFMYNVLISLSNFSLKSYQNWQLIGFQHYLEILIKPDIYLLLFKTIVWTSLNLLFHVSIGVFLAVIIHQILPLKGVWRTLLIIPWALPQYIAALTWRGLFNQEYGPVNQVILKFLHLDPVQWLTDPWLAFSACLLTNIWLGFPFMMVVAMGGLQSIPEDLYEAARLDGASSWQRFRMITWPLLKPVLKPAVALGAVWTFNNLNVLWLVSNGGEPADSTHILVSYIYKSGFHLYRYAHAAAASMLTFFILLAVCAWILRQSQNKKGSQT